MNKMYNNKTKLNADTYSLGAGLSVYSKDDIKKTIKVTNNKALSFANLAKKYRDEAKTHCENARQYVESNSNVSYDQFIDLKVALESQINTKQESGDYALSEDIPVNISELENDIDYVTESEMNSAIGNAIDIAMDNVLPDIPESGEKFLAADGGTLEWVKINREEPIFAIKPFDHVLTFEESEGYSALGSWVYKEGNAGTRHGYPDFYSKCLEEKAAGIAETITVGEYSFTAYKNANGHIFYNIAQKTIVDSIYNSVGAAWYYGIDEANERIFLPRNDYFFQSGNAENVGSLTELGLPSATSINGEGGVSNQNVEVTLSGAGADQFHAIAVVYYMVVGNTKSTTALANIMETTTSENDTIPLFTGMYFEFAPNNASWLKAGTQENSGGIYTSCYNTLVNCLTPANNIYNLKVIEESAMIAGVDYSEYWKVNQTAQWFKTPSKISYLPINSNTAPVIGTGIALGLTNGTDMVGLKTNSGNYASILSQNASAYGQAVGTSNTASPNATADKVFGVTADPSKSGIIADLSSAKSTTAQLYFKVANAVQNVELLDVGEVLETLADKQDKLNYKMVESYVNGTSGYNLWQTPLGLYCEQWGTLTEKQGTGDTVITFLKTFKDTNYHIDLSRSRYSNSNYAAQWENKTVNSMSIHWFSMYTDWHVSGYLA